MSTKTAGMMSQKIKNRISEAGISVHALEKKAGLKQSSIQNIIYGKSKKPSFHIMQSIAQALNCTVTELLEEENEFAEKKEFSLDTTQTWNIDLYIDVLSIINMLSKQKNIFLSKEKMFDCAEEVYEYTLRNKKSKPDKSFAEWLIEKISRI
jgi:transcriptional regulator with XRE-family HTH domain